MEITVTKLTDLDLLHKCAEYTTGHECKMSLAKAYANGHSIIRSQLFFVEMRGIPLFVASQLVRSHVGVQFFQRSKRTDRGGGNFVDYCSYLASEICKAHDEDDGQMVAKYTDDVMRLPEHFDRMSPTDLCFIINAEALINMAHKRLCRKASSETLAVMESLCCKVRKIDPALEAHMVPMCIYRGGICPEPNSCGIIGCSSMQKRLAKYKALFENT